MRFFKSWTIIFNLILISAGVFDLGIDKDIRKILVINGITGIGLRIKTKGPIS